MRPAAKVCRIFRLHDEEGRIALGVEDVGMDALRMHLVRGVRKRTRSTWRSRGWHRSTRPGLSRSPEQNRSDEGEGESPKRSASVRAALESPVAQLAMHSGSLHARVDQVDRTLADAAMGVRRDAASRHGLSRGFGAGLGCLGVDHAVHLLLRTRVPSKALLQRLPSAINLGRRGRPSQWLRAWRGRRRPGPPRRRLVPGLVDAGEAASSSIVISLKAWASSCSRGSAS